VGERSAGARRGFVARFDGQSWTEIAVPATAALADFRLGPDGSQWLAGADDAGGGVWRRPRDGRWTRVTLPAPPPGPSGQPEQRVEIRHLVVRSADEIWAVGTTAPSALLAVYRTKPTSTVFSIPEEDEARRKRAAYQPPKIATRRCTTLFALLHTPSKVAPADYSYPLTREALKGHTEFASARFLEAEQEGMRYFGAMVQDYDLGQKLVKLIREKVKTNTPVLLCREPYHIVRDVRFDLRTGALAP
jgi:hypothetical protein